MVEWVCWTWHLLSRMSNSMGISLDSLSLTQLYCLHLQELQWTKGALCILWMEPPSRGSMREECWPPSLAPMVSCLLNHSAVTPAWTSHRCVPVHTDHRFLNRWNTVMLKHSIQRSEMNEKSWFDLVSFFFKIARLPCMRSIKIKVRAIHFTVPPFLQAQK